MNFNNRSLTRNPNAIKKRTAAAAATPIRSGTNVKTTTARARATETETAAPASTSVGNTHDTICRNFISPLLPSSISAAIANRYCCCPTPAISCSSYTSHKNKKITQQRNNSRGMCDTTTAAPAEVMPPLTSMSAEQIALTSRVNIMDKDVENEETTTAATTTTTTSASSRRTTHPPALATSTSTHTSSSSRNLYQSIKMPLRRLILTIMAAVVLSTEFTICSTGMLEAKLATTSLSNESRTHIPPHTTNKSSKVSGSLANLPVNSTTLTTILSPAPSIRPSSSSLSATSISTSVDRKSLKSLETAALIEAVPSSASSVAVAAADVETAENPPFLSSSLTATTLIQNEPLTLDDFNASSELLSVPTSILSTYDASDLPPLTEAEQAAKDLLTKGFSIPTYLPPFPVFAVADLPAYLNTVSTTTTETPSNHHMSPDDMSSLENLLYFDNTADQQQHQHQQHQHRKLQIPRRNSSLAGVNNVTVQEGNHAYLPCRIHRLQNKPVSWVRLRDGHIISVDQTTFIADQRFQAIFQDDKEYTWSLQIKYVLQTDEGWYECQASSEPKMSAKVYLKVIVPLTELIGDQSRFVKAGSKVALHCIVRGTLDPPQYIIWYRDRMQISDDNKMGWYTQLDRNIFGNNIDNENTIGSLIIPSVRKMDSGNYTCQPSNSASVSVDLHVLSGEYSASAIMSAARTATLNDSYLLILLLLMLLRNT